jgi:hypothetical protein
MFYEGRRARVGHSDGDGQNVYRYESHSIWLSTKVLEGGC